MTRFTVAEAASEDADARSWVCVSCDHFIEDSAPGPHCRTCADYWRDVDAGLFDDAWGFD